jgi:hypothetical protein
LIGLPLTILLGFGLGVRVFDGLNVESGLNDGICVPILFVFFALAAGSGAEGGTTMLALKLVAEEIGIGIAVGVGLTVLGSWLLKLFADRGWIAASPCLGAGSGLLCRGTRTVAAVNDAKHLNRIRHEGELLAVDPASAPIGRIFR